MNISYHRLISLKHLHSLPLIKGYSNEINISEDTDMSRFTIFLECEFQNKALLILTMLEHRRITQLDIGP